MSQVSNKRPCRDQHPNPAATAYRCAGCAFELSGLGEAFRRPGLCELLGQVTRVVDCASCTGRVALKVFSCPKVGETTLTRKVPGVTGVCDSCRHWKPLPATSPAMASAGEHITDTFSRVSPVGTGLKVEGAAAKKPWEYPSTAIIPHLATPEYLRVLIELLRLQTRPPYIVVVDTGSPFKVCDELESMRSDDVEIHFIRANGYCHTSEPVCVALDVGFARANTPLIFLTHTDCFPTKRNALEWLGDQVSETCPVVGWEMSERSWITDDWKGIVSHTFTMLHSRTMREIGASWHMGRARDQLGLNAGYRQDGWPDTETAFAYCLRAAQVPVKLLGPEVNYERQVTDWWDHGRSLTGTRLYAAGSSKGEAVSAYAGDALAEAEARVNEWHVRPRGPSTALQVLRSTAPVKG
jgi:DNA-directed RNA polymerase subunit RPC12/RpoP